ncbi:PilN domain-containing protein [bacterium]|nr:PilN domain-containing protein [bacterium]
MIRIDLGRGEKKQGDNLRKAAAKLKLQQPYEELLAKFDNDASRLAVFFVAVAVAFLPQLLVSEYGRVVTRGYEAKTIALEKELRVVESESESLLPFKKELESYDTQKAQVNQRLSVIRTIIDTRNTPVLTLDAVSQALPEGTWIDSVSYESAAEGEKLSIEGKALTNEDVSDFVDRLAQSSYLKNVRIGKVDPVVQSNREVRAFTLSLEASNPDAPGVPVRDVAQKEGGAK